MLQYAIPNVPQPFPRPVSSFVDSLQRRPSTSTHDDYSIPRPPSTLAHQPSDHFQQPSFSTSNSFDPAGSQPALSTLAFLAANAPALVKSSSTSEEESTRSSTPASSANMSTQYAPAATPGGSAQTGPPVCANCSTSTTPLWRRDESGSVLCNACGLFLKLHGRPRPISLKTDVIKSRNRVKTSQARKRDSSGQEGAVQSNGYPAAHPDAAGLQQGHSHGLPMGMGVGHSSSNPSTNGNGVVQPNASHQIFDTVSLPSDAFPSPSLPAYALQHPSPSSSTLNGHTNMDPPHNYETIINQNNTLRTRVSELEVINDLFRGRVAELEASEQEARRTEHTKAEEVQRLNALLQAANARTAEMESRLADLEAENNNGPARKRQRLDHNGEAEEPVGSGATTPGVKSSQGNVA